MPAPLVVVVQYDLALKKGTKGDEIEEIGEPAERLLDPIFKVGANNKPQCSFKLEVPEYSGKLR